MFEQGSEIFKQGVKNLLPGKKNLPVTRIVDALMDMKNTSETEDYRYYDPKTLRAEGGAVPKNKTTFQDCIVFVVGGGSYVEYQNLVDYIKRQTVPKSITYGTTELLNPKQFIRQLHELGKIG
eukprot:Nk52_evm7s269 gene=Nk52_evmTU7s269